LDTPSYVYFYAYTKIWSSSFNQVINYSGEKTEGVDWIHLGQDRGQQRVLEDSHELRDTHNSRDVSTS
jgi:hypothetical protein